MNYSKVGVMNISQDPLIRCMLPGDLRHRN